MKKAKFKINIWDYIPKTDLCQQKSEVEFPEF